MYVFDQVYSDLAKEVGVKLAPRSDPDKSFAPCSEGKVLGVMYNTEKWTWWVDESKHNELLQMMAIVRDSMYVSNGHMMKLNGKINHMVGCVPGGEWQR